MMKERKERKNEREEGKERERERCREGRIEKRRLGQNSPPSPQLG